MNGITRFEVFFTTTVSWQAFFLFLLAKKRLLNTVCIMNPAATVKTSRRQLKLNPTVKAQRDCGKGVCV